MDELPLASSTPKWQLMAKERGKEIQDAVFEKDELFSLSAGE